MLRRVAQKLTWRPYAADTIRGTALASGRARRQARPQCSACTSSPTWEPGLSNLGDGDLGCGEPVRFLLTASLVYDGIRLAKPAVRRLRGHRTGRK